MDDQKLHEIALTFAEIKLQHYLQKKGTPIESSDDEMHYFAKMYNLAITRFEIELDSID